MLINPGRGHQLMPAINIANGKVALTYYSLYEDSTFGELLCPPGNPCTSVTQRQEYRKPMGSLFPDPPSAQQVSTVFGAGIQDAAPLQKRHTMDVRVAIANLGLAPSFKSTQVSQYLFGSSGNAAGAEPIQQLRFNVPDLPLFVGGTQPFMGDYIDIGVQRIIPTPVPGVWIFNELPISQPHFHAVWTDNRDVRAPADGNWQNYTPIPLIGYVAGQLANSCSVGQAGVRNQNIYTSRITQGLLVSAPGNSKQLSTTLQRTFSVLIQNNNSQVKTYRLTIANQPPGGQASFLQNSLLTTLDVTTASLSSASRSVFATSSNPRAQILINVNEITAPGGTIVSGGQQDLIVLNPDLTNPDLTNPDLTNPSIQVAEIYTPNLASPDLTNPDLTNPDLTNPDLTNPDLTNPDLTNQDLTNMGVAAPDLTNPDLTNPDLTNPDLTNFDIAAASLTDQTTKITNTGNTTATFAIRLVTPLGQASIPQNFKLQLILSKTYATPAAPTSGACQVIELNHNTVVANVPNPQFISPLNPDLTNPDLTNPDLTNTTLTLAPGETGLINLRIQAPTRQQAMLFANNTVQPAAVAQAASTGAAAPASALVITTIVAPNAQLDVPYTLQLQAVGGTGALTWNVAGLPPGLSFTPAGLISGIPIALGMFNATITVTDSGTPPQQATRPLSILVSTLTPFTIAQIQPPGGTVGLAFSYTPTASGGTPPYNFTFFGNLPPGLNVAAVTGVISGTPTATGTFSGYYVVQDSSAPAQAGLFPITIIISTSSLTFSTQPVNGTVGVPLAQVAVRLVNATASPIPGVTVTMTLDPNSSGATLSGTTTAITDGTGTATFSNLQINQGGTNLHLRASAAGVGPAVSNAFSVPPVTADYTDPAAFAAATQSPTTIGFNGILMMGQQFSGFNPLMVSGVSFSTPTPGVNVNVTTANFYPPNDYPADFIVDSANTNSNEQLVITLAAPVYALALNYGGLGFHGGPGSATITLSNGHVFTVPSLPTVGNTNFVGFVSTEQITSVTIATTNDDWVVENLILATP